MNCLESESKICDYLDGALAPASRAEMELHLSECAKCAALGRDAAAAMAFMGRAANVEAPPELIARILLSAPGPQTSARAGGLVAAFRNAMLAPRLAMGMAMTIFSLTMAAKFATPSRQLTPSDFTPARIWAGFEDRAYGAWAHTVKFYDNLRFVYEIETTIRGWQQGQDEQHPNRNPDEHKQPPAPAGPAPLSVIVAGREIRTTAIVHRLQINVAYSQWPAEPAERRLRTRPVPTLVLQSEFLRRDLARWNGPRGFALNTL